MPSPSPKSESIVHVLHLHFSNVVSSTRLCFRFVDEMATIESFAINEAYEFENQQHQVEFDEKSCSGCLQRKYSLRLWNILLFLFVVAVIIVLAILLSPGILPGKKAAASNGRKYNKHFINVWHKLS